MLCQDADEACFLPCNLVSPRQASQELRKLLKLWAPGALNRQLPLLTACSFFTWLLLNSFQGSLSHVTFNPEVASQSWCDLQRGQPYNAEPLHKEVVFKLYLESVYEEIFWTPLHPNCVHILACFPETSATCRVPWPTSSGINRSPLEYTATCIHMLHSQVLESHPERTWASSTSISMNTTLGYFSTRLC